MGQLLHRRGTPSRWPARSCPGHGQQFSVRGRALRRCLERQPHLLPHAVPAALLTSMILGVYGAQKAAGHEDHKWLEKAYQLAVKDHSLWVVEPHLAGSTELSRYFDFGDGPAPESVKDETGHYREVVAYILAHPDVDQRDRKSVV